MDKIPTHRGLVTEYRDYEATEEAMQAGLRPGKTIAQVPSDVILLTDLRSWIVAQRADFPDPTGLLDALEQALK